MAGGQITDGFGNLLIGFVGIAATFCKQTNLFAAVYFWMWVVYAVLAAGAVLALAIL